MEGNLVVDVKQCAIYRARTEADYQEPQEIIEPVNAKGGEQKQKCDEQRRRRISGEALSRVLDDRISVEETELFQTRMEMEELSKERRTDVDEWRASDAVESGVTRKAASGARGSKGEVGHSNVPEVDVTWKGTREDQKSVCSVEDSQGK